MKNSIRIQTVLGFVDSNEIVHVQPHEHLMLEKGHAASTNSDLCIDNVDVTVSEVKKLPARSLVVDAQPIGAGRMAMDLIRVSKRTGVHIVASTGFHKSMFYWRDHWIHNESAEILTALFVSEIQKGMYVGNGIERPTKKVDAKAGLIKTAVDKKGLTPYYQMKFEAAAEASLLTNVPIMVHIEKESDPFEIIQFLTDKQVAAKKIILCHLDRTHHDYGLHKEVAATGVYLEYDTIGRFKYHSDDQEIELIHHMLNSGFQESLLISLDTTRARLQAYGGEIGIDYLTKTFIPKLKVSGISDKTISTLVLDNPLAALSV